MMELFLENEQLLLGLGASLVVITLLLKFVLSMKAPRKELTEVLDEKTPAATPIPQIEAPLKKVSFGKAISSWIPLLNAKTKDKDQWEEVLIMSDMGPSLTDELVNGLSKTEQEPQEYLKSTLKDLLKPAQSLEKPWTAHKPWVLFLIGVNGVGKTSTVVKLAKHFKDEGKTLGVVGADTFRKAAIEQLERGCQKVEAEFFSHRVNGEQVEGADPAAVIFDGLKKFSDRDVVIVDTSGRLHTKKNLMEELKKMSRSAEKSLAGAPHDVWLVLDATLGQNALEQARVFHEALGLSGMVITKMDGLSRGGTIFQLFRELGVPIRFLGVGEQPKDLQSFDFSTFVEDLFDQRGP